MKVLLITDVPPCTEFSGALLTQQLCAFMPPESIVCFSILNPALDYLKTSPTLCELPLEFCAKPNEFPWRAGLGRFDGLMALAQEFYTSRTSIPVIIKKIVDYGRQNHVDRVWCVIQGQTMIRVALPVAEKLNVPLHLQIWDSPMWWIRETRLDRITRNLLLKQFDETVRRSASCGVASFAMAEDYRSRYGVKAVPLIASLDCGLSKKPSEFPQHSDKLLIGVAGQLYSDIEWSTLLHALERASWNVGGRQVTIRYLGYYLHMDLRDWSRRSIRLEFLGYHSQNETISLMAECDVLYCPYPFAPDFEIVARTSFPSKLTTYLAAGKPVLFHGPEYSAPAGFLKENKAGVFCHSLDWTELIGTLELMVADRELYASSARNGHRAFREYLTLDHLRRQLAEFLQVDENQLMSLA